MTLPALLLSACVAYQLSIDICCRRPRSAANQPHAASAVDRHRETDGYGMRDPTVTWTVFRVLRGRTASTRAFLRALWRTTAYIISSAAGDRSRMTTRTILRGHGGQRGLAGSRHGLGGPRAHSRSASDLPFHRSAPHLHSHTRRPPPLLLRRGNITLVRRESTLLAPAAVQRSSVVDVTQSG